MLFHHLKFSRRIFLKNGFFSTLNVLGLTLGIAVGIILLLVLQSDLAYDQHYANHKRIFRLGAHYQITGVDEKIAVVARELAPILRSNYPEIENMASIRPLDRQLVKYDDHENPKAFYEADIVQSDANYFSVFDHAFIFGDPAPASATLTVW